MATRPELNVAVAGTANKASEYNENFELMMDFVDDSIDEAKDYVDDFMPSQTGQSGKFLTTNGTNTSWLDFNPAFTTLDTSGTITLATNSINTITPSAAVTFTLPTVSSDTKLNQILVQINMTTVYSIDVGTTNYFNKKTPDLSETGKYNLIYEYDEVNDVWVCGWMKKGTV